MDENDNQPAPRPPFSLPFYYGWFIIGLSFLAYLAASAVRSAPSVLIHPLEREFGWGRTAISAAASLNLLTYGLMAPVGGWLLDRYGARRVVIGCSLDYRRRRHRYRVCQRTLALYFSLGSCPWHRHRRDTGAGGERGEPLVYRPARLGARYPDQCQCHRPGHFLADSHGANRVPWLAHGDDVDRRHGVIAVAGDLVVAARLSCGAWPRTLQRWHDDIGPTQSGARRASAIFLRHLRRCDEDADVLAFERQFLRLRHDLQRFGRHPYDSPRHRARHRGGDGGDGGGHHGRGEFYRDDVRRLAMRPDGRAQSIVGGLFVPWLVAVCLALRDRLVQLIRLRGFVWLRLVRHRTVDGGADRQTFWPGSRRRALRLGLRIAPNRQCHRRSRRRLDLQRVWRILLRLL